MGVLKWETRKRFLREKGRKMIESERERERELVESSTRDGDELITCEDEGIINEKGILDSDRGAEIFIDDGRIKDSNPIYD